MRRGDRVSAPLKRSRTEFEVFRHRGLSATHTRRLHSGRDSGPRSSCGRGCSGRSGGGGGGRGLQLRAIATAPAHFLFDIGRPHRLPVSYVSIGRQPGDLTPGARVEAGKRGVKGPWLRRGLGPARR